MFFRRGGNSFIGIALLFMGIGMFIATLLPCGWLMTIISIAFILFGTYLVSGC